MIKNFSYYQKLLKEITYAKEIREQGYTMRLYETCEGPILGVGDFRSPNENKTFVIGYLSEEEKDNTIYHIQLDRKLSLIIHNLNGPAMMSSSPHKKDCFYIDGLHMEKDKFEKEILKIKVSAL